MDRIAQDPDNVGIVVDGKRPAVEWVTSLPRGWVTSVQHFVLLALACDSFDGDESAPGWANLAAWTSMDQRDVRKIVRAMEEPTETRPPLVARSGGGGAGRRARLRLLRPDFMGSTAPGSATEPAEKPAEKPADKPADKPGVHSPTALALALGPEEERERTVDDEVEELMRHLDPSSNWDEIRAEIIEQHRAGRRLEMIRDLLTIHDPGHVDDTGKVMRWRLRDTRSDAALDAAEKLVEWERILQRDEPPPRWVLEASLKEYLEDYVAAETVT
jgi:hypothetical protein